MQDPLSISATILPKTSYDPLTRSDKMLETLLKTQQDKVTAQSKLYEDIKAPTQFEDSKFRQILNERSQLFDYGTQKTMEGYDLKDYSNPKNIDKALEFRDKMDNFQGKVDKYNNLKNLYDISVKSLMADEGKDLDVDATKENLKKLKEAKTLEEADKFLDSIGNSLLVVKKKYLDVGTYIGTNLDKFITPKAGKTETPDVEKGISTTIDYEKIEAPQAKAGLKSLYKGSEDFKDSVENAMKKDATYFGGFTEDEQLDWLYQNYGNRKLKETINKTIQTLPGYAKKKSEDITVYPGGISTDLWTEQGVGEGRFAAEGEMAVGFKEKSITINTGSESVDKKKGIRSKSSATISFRPISSAVYKYLKKDINGTRSNGTKARGPMGSILSNGMIKNNLLGVKLKEGDYGKRRYVEGYYTDDDGDTGTLLVPYDDIKQKMCENYDGLEETITELENKKPADINMLRKKYGY